MSQSIWSHQFSETRLFPASKVDEFVPHTRHVNNWVASFTEEALFPDPVG